MIANENKIRVRYDEVDKMGYVYHGNYAKYYHISRTELLRKIGISDKELENNGILLPVIEMNIKYIKPIFYDEIISIKTTLTQHPASRMMFTHKVLNYNNELVNEASSTLAFVNIETRMPIRIPQHIEDKIKLFIKLKNH